MKLLLIAFFLFSKIAFAEEYNYAKELYLNQQYTRAVYQFDSLIAKKKTDKDLVGLTASLWMLGDTRAAQTTLNTISNKELASQLKLALEVSSAELESLSNNTEGRQYLIELKNLEADPYKSPSLAALYSVLVPGAGHIYLGAYQSAAIVFAFNVLTGLATVEFANKDLKAPAIASGVIFSIFYVGGVYSAYEGANKMNQLKISKAKKDLNTKYFPILKLDF